MLRSLSSTGAGRWAKYGPLCKRWCRTRGGRTAWKQVHEFSSRIANILTRESVLINRGLMSVADFNRRGKEKAGVTNLCSARNQPNTLYEIGMLVLRDDYGTSLRQQMQRKGQLSDEWRVSVGSLSGVGSVGKGEESWCVQEVQVTGTWIVNGVSCQVLCLSMFGYSASTVPISR